MELRNKSGSRRGCNFLCHQYGTIEPIGNDDAGSTRLLNSKETFRRTLSDSKIHP